MSTPPCLEGVALASRAIVSVSPEHAQARTIVDAVFSLSEAKRALSEKGGNAAIFEEVLKADEELSRFFVILLGINPENEGDTAAMARWDALSSEEQLDSAWFYLGRVVHFLGDALGRAAKRQKAKGAIAHLQNAQSALIALDPRLWREKLEDLPTIGRPGAGHGSVNLTCKRLYQSTVYDRRWFRGEWLKTYGAMGATEVTRRRLRAELAQYIRIQNAKHRAIGLFCDIYDQPETRACRVMKALEILSMEASEAYHFLMGGDALSDGWRTGLDAGMWAALDLPSCREAQ